MSNNAPFLLRDDICSDRSIVRFSLVPSGIWYTRYIRASGSHRCVGTLEAPTSYGNNRLCLRAVGARKLVEILIKGAIPLLPTDKYELHPQCSHPRLASRSTSLFSSAPPLFFLPLRQMKMEKTCCSLSSMRFL